MGAVAEGLIKDLREAFAEEPRVALSESEDRDGIGGSLQDFLGKSKDRRSGLP